MGFQEQKWAERKILIYLTLITVNTGRERDHDLVQSPLLTGGQDQKLGTIKGEAFSQLKFSDIL